MNEPDHENQHAPLSYHGAWRIVWLVSLLIIVWLILRALQPVILLFALVFLLAMVLNPIVVWLQKHRVPRFVSVILLMLALVAVTTTIVLFAIPPLTTQTQELVRSTPSVWQGIRARIESLTKNYPEVREALPRTDEIAGKAGAAAGTLGNFLLRSTIGLVGGVASFVFAILLLVFVLANPRPLVAAYLALAPDRYREQAHRTLARLMRQMTAWARGVAINGVITGLSIGMLLWLIGVQPALIFGVFAFLGEFLPNIGAFLVSIPFCWSRLAWARQNSGSPSASSCWFTKLNSMFLCRACSAKKCGCIPSTSCSLRWRPRPCSDCWEFFSLSPPPRWCKS